MERSFFGSPTFSRLSSQSSTSVPLGTSSEKIRLPFRPSDLNLIAPDKVKNKQGVPELQIIVSFNKPDEAQSLYKERWQIETAFKALKISVFNIEDTHLTDIDRIEKLFALVLVAFVWAYKVGIFLNSLRPIKIKKHGRRAQSLFKYGLTYLANALSFNDIDKFSECCKFLSCT